MIVDTCKTSPKTLAPVLSVFFLFFLPFVIFFTLSVFVNLFVFVNWLSQNFYILNYAWLCHCLLSNTVNFDTLLLKYPKMYKKNKTLPHIFLEILLCVCVCTKSWLQTKFWELQSFSDIIETTEKNGVFPVATSNLKKDLKGHVSRFKIISLYIYKDLRLKTILGLMSHVTIIPRMAT